MTGVLQGFQKSQDRQMKIKAARDSQRIKNEEFDLKKQALDLKKKEFERKGKLDPMIQGLLDVEYAKIKAGKGIGDAVKGKQDDAERKEVGLQGKARSTIATMLDALDSQGLTGSYVPNKGFGAISKKKTDRKVNSVDKVLGSLDSGGVYDPDTGDSFDFNDKGEAEAYAQSELGYGWKKKFPKASQIIEEKYGQEEIKWFRNKETGKSEQFKKVDGQWEKAQ